MIVLVYEKDGKVCKRFPTDLAWLIRNGQIYCLADELSDADKIRLGNHPIEDRNLALAVLDLVNQVTQELWSDLWRDVMIAFRRGS